MSRPLTGIKVLDFSNLLPGPFCSMNLVELGATVMKVERPPYGDPVRHLSSYLFEQLHREKKSIAIDFTNNEHIDIVKQLVKDVDIVIEGFRPGTMAKFGLSYEELEKINPSLIYCAISGYGQTGPNTAFPGHDINYLATAGTLSISGEPDGKDGAYGGIQLADLGAALYATNAILVAILHRQQTGQGDFLDVSITDCTLALMSPRICEYYDKNMPPKVELMGRGGYGVFEAQDGRKIAVGCMEDHFFKKLCTIIEQNWLLVDERFVSWHTRSHHFKELNAVIANEMKKQPAAYWLSLFTEHDCPCNIVNDLGMLHVEPQFVERNLFIASDDERLYVRYPVKFANDFRKTTTTKAPLLGESNLATKIT